MAGLEGLGGSSWGTRGGGACDFLRRRYSFLERETDSEGEAFQDEISTKSWIMCMIEEIGRAHV